MSMIVMVLPLNNGRCGNLGASAQIGRVLMASKIGRTTGPRWAFSVSVPVLTLAPS
jgi:hypothetical protein